MTENYYQILGLKKEDNPSPEDIKKAYHKLARKWHPDKWMTKNEEEKQKATEEMKKINRAFEVLGDENKRKKYDETGETATSSSSSQEGSETFEEFADSLGPELLKEDFKEIKEKLRKAYNFLTPEDKEKLREVYRNLDRAQRRTENLEEQAKILEKWVRLGEKLSIKNDTINEIENEFFINKVRQKDPSLNSLLWAPYSNWYEKLVALVNSSEFDEQTIKIKESSKGKILTFKKQIIDAIRKRGEEIKQGINVPAVERVRVIVIQGIEKMLEVKGLKAEELGKYSNYKEQINDLPKERLIYDFKNLIFTEILKKSLEKDREKFKPIKPGKYDKPETNNPSLSEENVNNLLENQNFQTYRKEGRLEKNHLLAENKEKLPEIKRKVNNYQPEKEIFGEDGASEKIKYRKFDQVIEDQTLVNDNHSNNSLNKGFLIIGIIGGSIFAFLGLIGLTAIIKKIIS